MQEEQISISKENKLQLILCLFNLERENQFSFLGKKRDCGKKKSTTLLKDS